MKILNQISKKLFYVNMVVLIFALLLSILFGIFALGMFGITLYSARSVVTGVPIKDLTLFSSLIVDDEYAEENHIDKNETFGEIKKNTFDIVGVKTSDKLFEGQSDSAALLAVSGFGIAIDILIAKVFFNIFRILTTLSKMNIEQFFKNEKINFESNDVLALFNKQVISRICQIGICLISVFALNTLSSIVVSFILSADAFVFDIVPLFLGVLALYIAGYFTYGIQLKKDVEGLI